MDTPGKDQIGGTIEGDDGLDNQEDGAGSIVAAAAAAAVDDTTASSLSVKDQSNVQGAATSSHNDSRRPSNATSSTEADAALTFSEHSGSSVAGASRMALAAKKGKGTSHDVDDATEHPLSEKALARR